MSKECVLQVFLSAKSKQLSPGDKVPDESDENLGKYRSMGLIGDEKLLKAKSAQSGNESAGSGLSDEQSSAVTAAIQKLLTDNPDDKTPNCKAIQAIVGFKVSAADRDTILEELSE